LGLVSSSRPESGFEPGKKPAPARFETQDRSIAEPAAEPKPGISLEESEAPRRRGGLFWPLLGLSLLAGAGYAVYTAYRFAVESPTPQASSSPSGGAESRDPDAQKYEAAAALLARGQAALALGAFEELARRHPNDASVLLGLAIAQQRKPDNAKTDGARVEETLLAAMKASPGNPAVLNNLGIFYARVGKLEAAVQLLTQARDLEPARAEPLLNLALAYELGEDWKSALRFYETYLVHPARDPSLIKAVADRLQKIEPFSRSQRLIEDEDALDGGWDDSLDGEDFARGKEAKR
jgi:tetratricopeptide (TPR) repeat protein